MKISIRGPSHNCSKKEIRYAANFCVNQLISKRLSNNIFVKFNLIDVPQLHSNSEISKETANYIYYKDYEEWGQIEPEEGYWEPPYRRFVITLYTKCSRHLLLKKVFHELTHLKQYAIGEMHDLAKPDMTRFRGKHYNNDYSLLKDYKKLPWEKEANKMEKILYRQYRDHLKETKLSF